MVPTLAAALGVKGHRPAVGTWDCKDLLYVFAVVNVMCVCRGLSDRDRETGADLYDRARSGL